MKVEKIKSIIKKSILLLFISCITISCTNTKEADKTQELTHSQILDSTDVLSELTLEQEGAFEALNSIQVQGGNLYSTFSGLEHDCLLADTSLLISQSELLMAMQELLTKYYSHISLEERSRLASQAVLAQEEYLVLQCHGFYPTEFGVNSNRKASTTGTWILPEVLGRRDVIVEW